MSDYVQINTRLTWHALLDALMRITLRLDSEDVSEFDAERIHIAEGRVRDLLTRQRAVPARPGEEGPSA